MRLTRLCSGLLAVLLLFVSLTFLNQRNVLAGYDERAYWKSYSNDYYYEHLETELEREIYRRVDAKCEEILLSDDYYDFFRIDLADLKMDYNPKYVGLVIEIFGMATSANPQYFFTGLGGFYFAYGENLTIADMSFELMTDFKDGKARQKAKDEIKSVVESYAQAVPENALPEEKEKIIHDMMCERISYGSYIHPSGEENSQNLYCGIKGKVVCNGYAITFEALMNRVGVPCVYMNGYVPAWGLGGHAWNAINLHGYWYYVDVTNDDCYDDPSYITYNVRNDRFAPEGLYATYAPKDYYDNMDENGDINYYSPCYIRDGNDLYFIVNDLDDYNGKLVLYLGGETTNVRSIKYKDNWYSVINCASDNASDYIPTVGDKDFSDFVERLYVKALGRDSEPEGKEFWCNDVSNNKITGSDCAKGFLLSDEFLKKKLDDEEFIKVLYRTFFDREAEDDPNGFTFWLDQMKTLNRTEVIICFINSEEWCNLCVSYGVRSGADSAKASVATVSSIAFATRLYTECLGRNPEQDGLEFWSIALASKECTGSEAAREFFYSSEFQDLDISDEEYVRRLYKTFMGRTPEEEGFNHWVNGLSNGLTRDEVFDFFCVCPEFTKICGKYSIIR